MRFWSLSLKWRSDTKDRTIKRGDIYYAEFNPVVGSEQGSKRLVFIISNNIGNRHSPTVIIAAITSRVQTKAKLPTYTAVNDFERLDKDSVVLLEQIRTVDKKRLKQYMGMMPTEIMAKVDEALAIGLGFPKRRSRKFIVMKGNVHGRTNAGRNKR